MTTHHTAQGLASLGRHGDTMLVHMSPHEVAGLNYLAKKQGTHLTINPDTGLPEAFSLGGFFKSLLPMAAGALTGGMGAPLWAGIAAGAATGAATNKDHLMGAITGGLGGYGGFDIGKGVASMMAEPATSAVTSTTPEMLSQGTRNLASSGINVADPIAQDTFKNQLMSTTGDPFAGAGTFSNAPMYNPSFSYATPGPFDASYGASAINPSGAATGSNYVQGVNLANTTSLNAQPYEASMWDKFKQGVTPEGKPMISDISAAGKIAMPVGGAILGGLEPSDIYGEPMKPSGKDKYDPYATLNLSNDTGLRLYAMGGTVTTGGLRDLYNSTDNITNPQLSRDGYGVGRLESLARQQSMNQAQTTGYAMGGPVSFADGGDANKDTMGLPSLTTDSNMVPNTGMTPTTGSTNTLTDSQLVNIMQSLGPFKGGGHFSYNISRGSNQGSMPSSDDSLISKVTANLKADPNYQPTNPIEASIVKQIKGTDTAQQSQGLGSLGAQPSQPMAPSYTASQPIGPTYYAGMNAPRGFAEGGETHLNLDQLPSLNIGDKNKGSNDILNSLNPDDPIVQQFLRPGIEKLRAQESALYGNGPNSILNTIDRTDPMAQQMLIPGIEKLRAINSTMYGTTPLASTTDPMGRMLNSGVDKMRAQHSALYGLAKGGYLDGAGDGMSDSIPATIEGKQPARLADGEFVVPADVVSHIGNGSSKAGSQRLYSMLDRVRKARTGHTKQGKEIKPEKYMPA
jgi:hypothetical protein